MIRAQRDVPDVIDDDALTIYVDGAMFGSPRRGGVGIRFVWVNDNGDEEHFDESMPATMGATNDQMDLESLDALLHS